MGKYTVDSHISVYPFTRQQEGQDIIIGRLDTLTFLVLPQDAVDLLDQLREGKTILEVQEFHYRKYNEVPDLEDLLNVLEQQGFVQLIEVGQVISTYSSITQFYNKKSKKKHYHFTNFSRSLAQKIFSRYVLLSCAGVIGLGLGAIALDPFVIPTWNAYFFKENFTLMRLVLALIGYLTLFLHEMAHLIAARAVGISSRLGIGNRMWFLVAETDMTGIWSIPRSQRYLPFLAGTLLDATSAAVLVLLLFAERHAWVFLHPFAIQLSQAVLLMYLMSLLWQCYLFVRTDFYFLIANYFRCRSLMKDTEVFLKNQVARALRIKQRVDQSHIPKSEKIIIRWYALLWLLGRVASLGALLFITVPLSLRYGLEIFDILKSGYAINPYAFVDALLLLLIVFVPRSIGFGLWLQSFCISRR